jgi:hypothetical protein
MSQKSSMQVGGESDGRTVPTKCPNQGGKPLAEGMEGRRQSALCPFSAGTKVRLRISHAGANLIAQGTVAYSRDKGGMGIAFTSIEPSSVAI